MTRSLLALAIALLSPALALAVGEHVVAVPSAHAITLSVGALQTVPAPSAQTAGGGVPLSALPEAALAFPNQRAAAGIAAGVSADVSAAARAELLGSKGHEAGLDMDRFTQAVGQQDAGMVEFGISRAFDNVAKTYGADDFGYAPASSRRVRPVVGLKDDEEGGELVSGNQEAQALHEQWSKDAKKRKEEFEEKVKAVRVGPFGITFVPSLLPDGRQVLEPAPTYEGQQLNTAMPKKILDQWKKWQPKIEKRASELMAEMKELMRQEAERHDEVHKKMEAIEKLAEEALAAKGADLQSWGIPNVTPINLHSYMRYTRLYRMDGKPTPLGEELHDMLVPIIKENPSFLAAVSERQFNAAVQLLQDSQRYRVDPDSLDAGKMRRLGAPIEQGYDYPEWRRALVEQARKVITGPHVAGDRGAGFVAAPVERQAAPYLKNLLGEVKMRMEQLYLSRAQPQEMDSLGELFLALHAATGEPIQLGPEHEGAVVVRHAYLREVVAELQKRHAPEEVIAAVMRSFPLGESLWRMAVHKQWEKGITGKGVKIAILDNGVDFDHPDFQSANVTIDENFTRDRGDLRKGGHGTPMASIFHAIAPDAEIQNYQVLSNTDLPGVALIHDTDKQLMKAMDRARANGANLISMSLGSAAAYADDEMAAKIAEFAKAGIVVVSAAGNSGGELPRGLQVGSPGTSPKGITVGAADYHGKKAAFSSSGLVFNPTENSVDDRVDVYAYGVNVKGALRLSKGLYEVEPVPYMYGSGTSPATPHVTGVLALAMQAAKDAGYDIMQPDIVETARAALKASVKADKVLPVLDTAGRVIENFVAGLKPKA